jgi:hypothetical protein
MTSLTDTTNTANSKENEETFMEKLNNILPNNLWCRIGIILSIIQAIIIIPIEIYILITIQDQVNYLRSSGLVSGKFVELSNGKALLVYHVIYILSQLFQSYLCIDAIYRLSIIQLTGFLMFNAGVLIYSIIQYFQAMNLLSFDELQIVYLINPSFIFHPTKSLEISIIIIMIIFIITWIPLYLKIIKVLGWDIYNHLGANLQIKKMLMNYHYYLTIIKLDWFFFLAFSLQFVLLVLIKSSLEEALLHGCISIPLTLITLIIAHYSIKKENKPLTIILIIALITGLGYLIYRLYDVYNTVIIEKYSDSKNFLSFFIIITLILVLITIVLVFINLNNFGNGLKIAIMKSNEYTWKSRGKVGDTGVEKIDERFVID